MREAIYELLELASASADEFHTVEQWHVRLSICHGRGKKTEKMTDFAHVVADEDETFDAAEHLDDGENDGPRRMQLEGVAAADELLHDFEDGVVKGMDLDVRQSVDSDGDGTGALPPEDNWMEHRARVIIAVDVRLPLERLRHVKP